MPWVQNWERMTKELRGVSIQQYDCYVNRAMSDRKIWEGRHGEKVVRPMDWKSS